jgi:ribose transport system substrate-binding protein
MTRGKFILIVPLALIALTSAGCGEKDESKAVYALVPKSVGHVYWAATEKGLRDAAADEDVDGLFVGPETIDVARQIAIMEGLIARRVAGIAIAPNDPTAVVPVIDRAVDSGIPVVTLDSDAPDSKRLAYVGTVNTDAGKLAGELLAKYIDGNGTVAISTGGLGSLNLNERVAGFREAIAQYPGIEEVAFQTNNDDEEQATTVAESILSRFPDLTAFFGANASGGPGAARAVKQAGKVGQVTIVGFDDTPICLQFIKEGVIEATVAQRPREMGYRCVKILIQANRGLRPESEIIDTGVTVITAENVDRFLGTQDYTP